MSIRSKYWALKYDLTFSDAGILDDVLSDTAGRYVLFSDGSELVTIKRMSPLYPVRGNLHDYPSENRDVYAFSKDSLSLIQSPLLKVVLQIILKFNKDHGGANASAYTEARTNNRSKQ